MNLECDPQNCPFQTAIYEIGGASLGSLHGLSPVNVQMTDPSLPLKIHQKDPLHDQTGQVATLDLMSSKTILHNLFEFTNFFEHFDLDFGRKVDSTLGLKVVEKQPATRDRMSQDATSMLDFEILKSSGHNRAISRFSLLAFLLVSFFSLKKVYPIFVRFL